MKNENVQSKEVKNMKDNTKPTFYFITNCRYKTKTYFISLSFLSK